MKTFIKAHYKKIIILILDVLCLAGAVVSGPISEKMLQQTDQVCLWDSMGIRCLTCGGTHFVHDLMAGRIGAAFMDNQYLFILTLFFAATLIVLNLYWLFNLEFAKKMLKWMYGIPSMIIFLLGTAAFFILRNLPFLSRVFAWVMQL